VGAIIRAVIRFLWALALAAPGAAHAGAQVYEPLAASVQASLHKSISDQAAPFLAFQTEMEARRWLAAMSRRLAARMPDRLQREEFLVTVHYEAKRAGLDPQLVLGLIQVESNFRKYAISRSGARGFMQVMPFWIKVIGSQEHNLFHLRINLRYGCVILRHYLDIENGDLFRALGRYNGSLGKPDYPTMVVRAWQRNWEYTTRAAEAVRRPAS
jgi:soluble lytic murein transglycosylase-like protein